MNTLFTSDEIVESFIKETQRGILSIKGFDPIFTPEEWHEKTEEIKTYVSADVMVCDGGYSLRGKTDYDIGLIGLMDIRNQIEYMLGMVLWCDPIDIESYDWDFINDRLKHVWKLIIGSKEKLPPVSTVHNLGTVNGVVKDIADTYLDPAMEETPWKLGVSWGKDSTRLVQLVVDALDRVGPNRWNRPIHLVTSDTCLELPPMLNIMRRNLRDFERFAKENGLPFTVHLIQPALEDRFFTNLVGKGYTPPLGGPVKRWCTPRLKIKASSKLDSELLSSNRNIIAVLGTRYDESTAREKSIKKWEGNSRYGYTSSPNILSYAPIVQLTTAQVWQGLRNGFYWDESQCQNYQLLEELYRASSFEDSIAEGGRMGCSVCFVVKRDKSLTNLIANGYEWLNPLIEFRETVLQVVDNRFYREPIPIDRRTGLPTTKKASRAKTSTVIGGINQQGREFLLARLLETQEELMVGMAAVGFEVEGGYELISKDEIHYIKSWWAHLAGYTEPGFIPVEVVPHIPDLQIVLF